jgi:hypothetical protein
MGGGGCDNILWESKWCEPLERLGTTALEQLYFLNYKVADAVTLYQQTVTYSQQQMFT